MEITTGILRIKDSVLQLDTQKKCDYFFLPSYTEPKSSFFNILSMVRKMGMFRGCDFGKVGTNMYASHKQ